MTTAFNLEEFEHFAYSRNHEQAAQKLLSLLSLLDKKYGETGSDFSAVPLLAVGQATQSLHVWVRLASAISCLFADNDFHIAPQSMSKLFTYHRWLGVIFASTPFINADHVVRAFNVGGKGDLSNVEVKPQDLEKLCLLYFPESEITLDLNKIRSINKQLAVSLAISLLSPRFLGSFQAHSKREVILPWLTHYLPEIKSLDDLPFGILHDLYMHCSYADRPDKHNVKKSINELIVRWLKKEGLSPLNTPIKSIVEGKKPVMVVVLEWFNSYHSIYRTHSRTLEAARELFTVIGVGYESATDHITRQVFDEFIFIEQRVS